MASVFPINVCKRSVIEWCCSWLGACCLMPAAAIASCNNREQVRIDQPRCTSPNHRRCDAKQQICVTFDSTITNVHVERMGVEVGRLDRQPDLPKLVSIKVGDATFDGLLAHGIRGTGIGQKVFMGWRKESSGAPDVALLYSQYEVGGTKLYRKLQFEPIACDRGAGMRWKYLIEGDLQQCKAVTEFIFCDYTNLPYPFLCGKPGQTLEEMLLGCGRAGYRAFELVAADAVLFSGCRLRFED